MSVLNDVGSVSLMEVRRQKELIRSNDMVVQMLDGMNIFVMLLNRKREIIFINKEFSVGLMLDDSKVIGHRPGEVLKCKYSNISEHGCGYSKECSLCIARNLVVETIHSGKTTKGQVSILSVINELELTSTFEEKVTKIQVGEENFYMVAFIDKSPEMERNNLERIFYHDIMNSATSLYNIIRFIRMENEKFEGDTELEMIEGYIQNIIGEIEYHRSITFAEQDKLMTTFEDVDINDLVSQVVKMLNKDERFHHINVQVLLDLDLQSIRTDSLILKRVFTNLLKNALEANRKHSVVRIKVESFQDQVRIIFHNDEVIPQEYRREIFIKGYSSKSKGRGLGVYGSKLLMEKYLKGNLNFVSEDGSGTEFIVLLPMKRADENSDV